MLILDSLLVGGLRFVLDKIVRAAEAEAQDDAARCASGCSRRSRVSSAGRSAKTSSSRPRGLRRRARRIRDAGRGPISMPVRHGADIEYFDAE